MIRSLQYAAIWSGILATPSSASTLNCGLAGGLVARLSPRHGPALDGTAASPAAPASPPGAQTSLPGQRSQAPGVIRRSRKFPVRGPRQPGVGIDQLGVRCHDGPNGVSMQVERELSGWWRWTAPRGDDPASPDGWSRTGGSPERVFGGGESLTALLAGGAAEHPALIVPDSGEVLTYRAGRGPGRGARPAARRAGRPPRRPGRPGPAQRAGRRAAAARHDRARRRGGPAEPRLHRGRVRVLPGRYRPPADAHPGQRCRRRRRRGGRHRDSPDRRAAGRGRAARTAGRRPGRHAPARVRARPARRMCAFVLHTSGTTSRPKQVPLRQRNLMASTRTIAAHYRLGQADVSFCVMPLFHIHGLVASTFAALRRAARSSPRAGSRRSRSARPASTAPPGCRRARLSSR